MTLERWIAHQRGLGNIPAAEMGEVLLGHYGDVAPLEQETEKPVLPVEKPRDLCRETFDLLGNLGEPTAQEREMLEKQGFIFLRVEAKSLGQVYEENKEYFDYVNPSEILRAYIPPQDFETA